MMGDSEISCKPWNNGMKVKETVLVVVELWRADVFVVVVARAGYYCGSPCRRYLPIGKSSEPKLTPANTCVSFGVHRPEKFTRLRCVPNLWLVEFGDGPEHLELSLVRSSLIISVAPEKAQRQ